MMPALLHLSTSLTAACAAGLWQGLTIAAVTAVLCGTLRGAPAALRHTVLLFSFAGAMVLPFLGMHGVHRGESKLHGLQLTPWIAIALAALWFVVAALRATQLWQAWLHLRDVRRRAVPVRVQGVEECISGARRAMLCSSPDVDAPTIIGFHAPRLLLPSWMVPGLSEEDLRQITLHECEHLRRGDDWLNLLLQVSLVVFPLNPALAWLMRTIRLQRELAVDEAVVARTAEPLAYATCLTRLAEQRRQQGHLRLALSAWSRKSELVQRVHALLRRSAAWTRLQTSCAFAGALAVLLGTTSLMAHAPQLVHVATAPAVAATNDAVNLAPASLPVIRTATYSGTASVASPALRAVATSFHVGAERAGRTHPASARSSRKSQPLTLVSGAFVQTRRAPTPRILRMSYVVTPDTSARSEEAPVQVVPALFYTPYAAVPVSEGWLLITL